MLFCSILFWNISLKTCLFARQILVCIYTSSIQCKLSFGLHKALQGAHSKAILLISCCHIVCTMFCNFSVFYCLVCILSKWSINGLPKSPDCPEPILHVCFLWTTPLLLADQLPHGSPDMILRIRRRHWKEELGMATKLSTTEKWAAIPLFKASSQLSSSHSYICVFSRY